MNKTSKAETGGGNAPRIDWKTFDKIEEQKAKIKALRQDRDYWMENAMNDADKLEKAEAQRDELLAALKGLQRTCDPYEILPLSEHPTYEERDSHNAYKQGLFVEALNKARAVIAKAEGIQS